MEQLKNDKWIISSPYISIPPTSTLDTTTFKGIRIIPPMPVKKDIYKLKDNWK